MKKLRTLLFSTLGKLYNRPSGSFLARIPGVKTIYYFLLQRLWPSGGIIEVQGSKMYMNPRELPERFSQTFQPFIFSGVWEPITTKLFKQVVKEGDVVVDLGANMGYFTLLASRVVGEKGKVYAFEPEPVNHTLLLKNIELNNRTNIIPLQKAVSNITGKVELFIHNKDSGRHTIRQSSNTREFGESVEVECVTLDEFFQNGPVPDVVKIDVEGVEMLALLGRDSLIRKSANMRVFMEFYPSLIEQTGYSVEEFAHTLLDKWGFSVTALDEFYKTKEYSRIGSADDLVAVGKQREISNLFLEKSRSLIVESVIGKPCLLGRQSKEGSRVETS